AMAMPTDAGLWQPARLAAIFAMWAAMMAAMMAPSVTPMLLLYARVARQARAEHQPFTPTLAFAGGYLLAWIGFSLAATAAQTALQGAQLLSPILTWNSGLVAGAMLVATGLYQWSPAKI